MRLAPSGVVPAVAIAVAAVLASCDQTAPPDRTAAASSRAQVAPAAREMYQSLSERSARSVDLLDWGYRPCRRGNLAYSISMRLFAFAAGPDTDFEAYRQQVVSIVRADGWALRLRPHTRSVTLPTVPFAYYWLSRRHGKVSLTGKLALTGDVNPLVGLSGTISMSGPCFDPGGAAESLRSHSGSPPFPVPRPSPSPSHS